MSVIIDNRKARFEYEISEVIEAGISLLGSEVKSIRLGKVSIIDAFVTLKNGNPCVLNMNIANYDKSFISQKHDPLRDKFLLLNKDEIRFMFGKASVKGYTLIPLNLHYKRGRVKMDIAVAKGKQMHDKRRDIKERDLQRQQRREQNND